MKLLFFLKKSTKITVGIFLALSIMLSGFVIIYKNNSDHLVVQVQAKKTRPPKPAILAKNQTIKNSKIIIKKVLAADPGWVVIHAQVDGQPGPTIGQVAIPAGTSKNVEVMIDSTKITKVLYAMLHLDNKTIGTYEFPEGDEPVTINGKIVSATFKVKIKKDKATPPPSSDQETEKNTQTPPAPPANNQPEAPKTETPQTEPLAKEFTIIAKKFSFEPKTITVKQGEKIKLTVTSLDTTHGLALPDFGINKTINPGESVTIEFTPDKKGTFSFFCSIFCGSEHSSMRGELVVE